MLACAIQTLLSCCSGITLTNQSSDQQLVSLVQAGDKRAFDLLVLKYQHKVHGLVRSIVRDPDESMDIAQEAFIKAYKALPNFRGDSQFYTWLYRIAANTAKNHLISRQWKMSISAVDIDDEDQESMSYVVDLSTPENIHARDELEALLIKALDKLPASLRRALELREFEYLSYEEIADILDCPIGTVRSRIFRAREMIDKVVVNHMVL